MIDWSRFLFFSVESKWQVSFSELYSFMERITTASSSASLVTKTTSEDLETLSKYFLIFFRNWLMETACIVRFYKQQKRYTKLYEIIRNPVNNNFHSVSKYHILTPKAPKLHLEFSHLWQPSWWKAFFDVKPHEKSKHRILV